MINEDSETSSGKDEDHLVPAFGVSGQFMMTSEEKAIPSDDFNPRKIVALTLDDSLARLFECLTLEYSGSILLTPKWKNFRSQKLKFAEKTRINNAIWRSWHIQFQMGQRPLFCQFDNPLTEMAKPPKPVTLMVEGKYWKRKLEVVAAEYQKWRVFYKQMVEDKFQDVELQHQTKEILRLDQEISDNLREREKERKYNVGNPNRSFQDTQSPLSLVVSQALEMVDSCNLMESMVFSLPDTLFTSLEDENQRVGKVTSRTFKDTADTVQPTLDTLQPSLEAMTPVLDELIEQLEASMKGSELNWDFPTLERNIDLPQMGLVQSSTGQEQVETMDHSGRYDEPCRPVGSQSLPSSGTSSWPMQTSSVPSQPMFVGSSQSQPRPESQVWTSSLGIHPGVMGVQTVGTEMPRSYVQTNATRPRSFSSNATSVVDIGELPGVSASPVITSRPYLSTPLISKRSAASAGLRHSIAVGLGSGRMPRNSSDSQLYLLSTSESSPSRSRVQTTVPVEVQAPNLVAQLKLSTKARPSLTEEKSKRPRLPRNRSAPGLASLEASALLKKAPQAGGVRAKRLGKIPRNRSDSSLASMIRQSEQGSSRQRRESESGDLLMAHSPSEEVANATTTQAYPRRNMIPFVVGSPPLAPAMSGCEEGASSQLVNEMVTHLMSKGISMEEILGKLTAMATVGSTHPSHMLSSQTTSLTSSVASIRQDPQVMQTSIAKRQVTPFLSTTTTVSSTQFSDTRSDTPRIAPSRSRRKPQTPRPSLKITQTECTAVNEPSGSRSTDDIIQNILSRNRQEFQTAATSRVPAIDPLSMRESTTVGSVPLWGNTETTSLFNHNRGLGTSSSPPRSIVSQPLAVQIAGTQMSFPTMIQGSTGDVMLQDASTVDKQLHGLRSFAVSNSGLTSSMMMSTPPAMTVSEASPSSGTIETNKAEGSTSSALRGNYKAETETPVRSRPLTKTLPKDQYMEHRRMVHVSAEQKRRGNIKMGFDQLIAMVPALASQGNSKISKAAVLKKTVDYLVQIQRENDSMKEEQDRLRKEIENLNVEISVCQQQLPETGVMVNRQDYNQMELFFNHYIQQRTEQNSKFWIFSSIMRPLFDAYNCTVSTANPEDFCRTVLAWLNEHCSLPKLRPSVLSSLREIIQKTSILSDPSKLPEQARLAANALEQRSAAGGRPR